MLEEVDMPKERSDWKRVLPIVGAAVIAVGGIGYAVHEHRGAQELAWQNQQVTSQLDATHKQLDATNSQLNVLAAKVDALNKPAPAVVASGGGAPGARPRRPAGMSDARWKKMQAQLDEQSKAIQQAQTDLQTTRGDLDSAKTELGGSIAKTHDELVVLQRRGEHNYYEFDLSKSKQFQRTGPLSISLRKANEKKSYADLQLIIDDRTMTQKHVNLFQPAMFYSGDGAQPMEIVINEISKDHIHGYISAPKYRRSELTAMSNGNAGQNQPADQANAQPPARQKLPVPKNDPNQ